MVIVSALGPRLHIFEIVTADIDIEEDPVVIDISLAQNMFEICLDRNERSWQAGFQLP